MGVGAKVRALALQRLRANKAVIHRWQEVRYDVHHPLSYILSLVISRAPIGIGVRKEAPVVARELIGFLGSHLRIKVWSHNRGAGDYAATRMLVSRLMVESYD